MEHKIEIGRIDGGGYGLFVNDELIADDEMHARGGRNGKDAMTEMGESLCTALGQPVNVEER